MLSILSFILLASYIGICIYKYGIPSSLSETYYILKENKKQPLLFTAALGIADILVWFDWLRVSDVSFPNISFLTFICMVSILFVAVAPNFRSIQKWVHTIGAIVGGLSAIIWCSITMWYIPAVLLLLAIAASVKKVSSVVFWFEMAAFLSVYICVLSL